VAALAAVLLVAACASDDDGVGDAPTSTAPTSPTTSEPLFTPAGEGPDDDAPTTLDVEQPTDATDEPAEAVPTAAADTAPADEITTLPTIPDTGVPGIDSTDVFCRSWSEFGGTFQGLAISWGQGDPPDAALNEVAASSAVLVAVDELDASLPAELETERADLMALVEPLARRAEAARDELLDAGVSPEGVLALGDAWIATLVEVGIDDPAIVVTLPAGVDAAQVEAAATAFADGRQSLVEDPSMITDVATPQTEQYLVANCPDQGTLLGNDDVTGAP
jgi:hypothetical protein